MHPVERFLGVHPNADAATVLGFSDPAPNDQRIAAALHRRLSMVNDHPAADTEAAETVRRHLYRAAESLRKQSAQQRPGAPDSKSSRPRDSQRPSFARSTSPRSEAPADQPRPKPALHITRPRPNLTAFDRRVLAVLISCGGWNAESRSRLVAVAGAHGVSPAGLLKVVTGLSEHVKSGGTRIAVEDITEGDSLADELYRQRTASGTMMSASPTVAAIERVSSNLQHKLSDQLRENSVPFRVGMSVAFACIAIAVCVLTAIFLLRDPRAEPTQRNETLSASQQQQTVDERPNAGNTSDGETADQQSLSPALDDKPLQIARIPTLAGRYPPPQGVQFAEQWPALLDRLDAITRKLQVSDTPSEATVRDWSVTMRELAGGWVLVDDEQHERAHQLVSEAMYYASSSPNATRRLLTALTPPGSALADPLDIWRGSWAVNALGRIAGDTSLPPVVQKQARDHLDLALHEDIDFDSLTGTHASAQWLEQLVPVFIERLVVNEELFDQWELWSAAFQRLEVPEKLTKARLNAVRKLLESSKDLASPGAAQQLLGRLITNLDYSSNRPAQKHLIALFNNDSITSDDLWVLTSLLAHSDHTPWFTTDFVLASNADQFEPVLRRRIRDRIGDAFPQADGAGDAAGGRGIVVDAQTGERWQSLFDQAIDERIANQTEALMRQLIVAAVINESASWLLEQDAEAASDALDAIEPWLTSSDRTRSGSILPGLDPDQQRAPRQPIGTPAGSDGAWAQAYEAARGNHEKQMRWLSNLQERGGGDLGPQDAAVFAQVVYRENIPAVRSKAQSILALQYANGPNVALAMLDYFPEAPRHESISQTIHELTGQLLPDIENTTWRVEARVALTEHALKLLKRDEYGVDAHADALTGVLLGRLHARLGRRISSASPQSPQEAMRQLLDAWRDRAAMYVPSDPVPGDRMSLRRRHATRLRLAEGPIQRFLAHQLAALELIAYVTAAEQPRVAEQITGVLNAAAQRRGRARYVLQQAVETERAIARLFRLQMALPESN